MIRKQVVIILVCIALFPIIWVNVVLAQTTRATEQILDLNQYASVSRPDAVEAMKGCTQTHFASQMMLLDEVQKNDSKQVKILAIYLLGIYRSESAAPILARMIDFHDEVAANELTDQLPLWGEYPVVDALIRIGVPSRAPLVENLATSDVVKVRELSVKAIVQIYGADCAKIILEAAQTKTNLDEKKIARLKDALLLIPK